MYWFVVLIQMALGADHVGHAPVFAQAIAYVAEHDDPPPGLSRDEGAALLAVTLEEEGKYALHAQPGDGGVARCSGQVHALSEAHARALEASPVVCARSAYAILRIGATQCPDHPAAPYAGGCANRAAQAISDRRMSRMRAALGEQP